mgnify:CR=1 FL=1
MKCGSLFAWALPTNNGKYITKKQLGQWIPAVSTNLKLGNHPLIDRREKGSAVRLIGELVPVLKRFAFENTLFCRPETIELSAQKGKVL